MGGRRLYIGFIDNRSHDRTFVLGGNSGGILLRANNDDLFVVSSDRKEPTEMTARELRKMVNKSPVYFCYNDYCNACTRFGYEPLNRPSTEPI